jgi:hypothetical protein
VSVVLVHLGFFSILLNIMMGSSPACSRKKIEAIICTYISLKTANMNHPLLLQRSGQTTIVWLSERFVPHVLLWL